MSMGKMELTKENNLHLLAGTDSHVCSVSTILSYLKFNYCDQGTHIISLVNVSLHLLFQQ